MSKGMAKSIAAAALLSLALGSGGCGSSNSGKTDNTSTGGATSPATSAGGTTAAGGGTTAAAGGTTAAAGGTSATSASSASSAGGGTTATSTTSKATGGTSASSASNADGSTTTNDGTTATAGGSTGTTATGTGAFSPLCAGLATAGNAVPAKGVTCIDADPPLCYKTCGPNSLGFKSETCSNGTYQEDSTCQFPDGDYSCYKIPSVLDAACPTTVPQAGQSCSVPDCTPCDVGGNYNDSSGASKVGYCLCPTPKTDGGTSKWTCASTNAWPCPAGNGC